MDNKILVTRSSMPTLDEYVEEIRSIWDSHWLTNMGVKHKELQAELEEYLEIPHVALYTNGHLALENAIAALNLPEGGEVITTPFTFASTTHAIVRNGLVPVFCDVNEKDYTIDVTKIEDLITDRTVAIVPVHVYGNLCDVEEIDRIAKKYGLKVIYDAAHAFAVKYKGVSSACFGDASMFSFHATKVFNTIEGGAVCFKNDSWVQLLNDQKNFGIHGPESVCYVGGNAKMNEFQAAMGICNLRHLGDEIAKRKSVVERYRERLSGVEGIQLSAIQENVESIDLIIHKGRVGEVYNVGGHNEKKNIEIVKIICKELGKPESLITHVGDRKGHDMRYAIDPTKIHNELGWLPETKFENGIKKTIQWYLDNREWWETIISGEYQNYYEKMYGNR